MGMDTYKFLLLICLQLLSGKTIAQREVSLNGTLIHGHLALPRQRITFTCVTRNSSILEWQSNEHIGTDGDDIQIYSVGNRVNVTSVTIPTTYATRVSVTVENGITVIVSQLFITTSDRFPTSSVTCRINGQGPVKTITFNTTARALQEVALSSTLINGHLAYPGQRVVFTCVTRNSSILEWRSDEHIGTDGDDIQIYSIGTDRDNVTSVTIPTTYATRDSVTMDNGITVIVSQLFITASDRFPTSSVTCGINSLGPRQTISFNTTVRAFQDVKLNSSLIRGNLSYPQQRIIFTCVTRNSTILEWQSNEYIGTDGDDIQIYNVGDRDSVTSVTIPTTYATRDSVTVENGITVIVSRLFITASEQFPTSLVTCRINSLGPRRTISFNIIDEEPPSPKLNSTLREGAFACPGKRHQFVCRALYSQNIKWTSHEYIGGHDHNMDISTNSPIGRPLRASGNTDTFAVMDRVENVNGGLQLTSTLYIVILPSLREQNHTVMCLNNDLGTQQSITFELAGNCEPEVTDASTEVKNENGDTGTSPSAAIIAGSIFAVVFTISIIGIIILAIVCIVNRGKFNFAHKNKPQAVHVTDPEVPRVNVEQSQKQTEAEKETPVKQCDVDSKNILEENGHGYIKPTETENLMKESVSSSSANTSATNIGLSQAHGALTDSDSSGEDVGSRSSCRENGHCSSVACPSLSRVNSTEAA